MNGRKNGKKMEEIENTKADAELRNHLDRLHTTELGVERIKRNLAVETEDIAAWCRDIILSVHSGITRRGKNWYIETNDLVITVNAHSYTIITAHRKKIK